jgi:NAD-dependent SIR2 family protein deacetylase
MTKGRKIIILGAGASIGSKRYPIKSSFDQTRDTMPSAENFFYDLFKMNKTDNRPAGSLNFLGLTYENLNDLIVRAWNIDDKSYNPDEWRGVNIEEVMTFFEAGSNMSPSSSDEHQMYKKAQRYLLDFLYPFMPMSSDSQHCEYLMRVFAHLDKKDSIISYNWDTIADFTLEKIKAVQLKNYAKLLRDKNIETKEYRHRGLLLKLHGSFNWMICQNRKCDYYNRIRPPFKGKTNKLLGLRDLWKCNSCDGGKLRPEIIPPVSNKTIHSNSFVRDQWHIAREKLLDASELVFIGYSFPPTDYYTEWLFRQLNFIEKGHDVKITVVNPEYGKRGSIVTKRYRTIFRGREIKNFGTLKEYAKG